MILDTRPAPTGLDADLAPDYRRPWSPFVDRFAHFSVLALPDRLGLGGLHPRGTIATYLLAEPTLMVAVDGRPVERDRLECRADRFLETGGADGWRIDAKAWFEDHRTMRYRLVLRHDGETPRTGTLTLGGRGQAVHPTGMAEFVPGARAVPRTLEIAAAPSGVRLRLAGDPRVTDLPDVELAIDESEGGVAWRADGDGYEGRADLVVPAGRAAAFDFRLRVRLGGRGDATSAPPTHAARLEGEPDEVAARLALLRGGLWGGAGEFGPRIASLCTADRTDFSCSFFWDSLFSAVAIARFHPEFARGAILTAFTRQDPADGATPERKWNFGVPQRMAQRFPQSPVGAWAVREAVAAGGDDALAADAYPHLVDNLRYWTDHGDRDGDGLAEYRWSGQAADDSPLWDPYRPREGEFGCFWLPPVASVALNSFLVSDARHLAAIADGLGRPADAARFRSEADGRERRLMAACHVAEERRLWDWDPARGEHRRVRTFYLFWPLAMGLDVPEPTRRHLIEEVLLDPAQFFGEVPFPSVAYDEPAYDPNGYWRGRAWPHIAYWLTCLLWREGYEAEADEAAGRWLRAVRRYPGFPENLPTADFDRLRPGFLDYNWGAAAYLLLRERAYRAPLGIGAP